MKVRKLDYRGLHPARAIKLQSGDGFYYALLHGEHLADGWQIRIPLGSRDFPCGPESPVMLPLSGDFGLLRLQRQDPVGNDSHLLISGQADPGYLILLDPRCPGAGGTLDAQAWGKARVCMMGYAATTPSCERAPMPVIHVGDSGGVTWKWSESSVEWEASVELGKWEVEQYLSSDNMEELFG